MQSSQRGAYSTGIFRKGGQQGGRAGQEGQGRLVKVGTGKDLGLLLFSVGCSGSEETSFIQLSEHLPCIRRCLLGVSNMVIKTRQFLPLGAREAIINQRFKKPLM